MESAISILNLSHYYGTGTLKRQVLFDIQLDIQLGEIVIMTGPSGSGKTTLLSLIGCLRSVQTGTLSILGQKLCGATKNQLVEARRNVGYIFQTHNLLKFLTAEENVRIPMQLSDLSSAEARRLSSAMLEQVGLDEHLHKYPENLSGGQQQRVAIARALVHQPKLILADEPTASLDSKSGRDVVKLLQQLAKEQGCTILLVTHDNRILDIADRIIHMEDGHIVNNPSVIKLEGAVM
jgi:putative ABC transport system ATP-binding protein